MPLWVSKKNVGAEVLWYTTRAPRARGFIYLSATKRSWIVIKKDNYRIAYSSLKEEGKGGGIPDTQAHRADGGLMVMMPLSLILKKYDRLDKNTV